VSADLVHDLRRLGDELEWPATPDVAATVTERLAGEKLPPVRPRHRRRRRGLAVALAAALLVPAAGAVAFPGARDDVLEWLGLKSVEVERVPQLPPGAREPARSELGGRVTLAEATRRAGFEPIVPPRLGPPREVRERDGVVTLVYDRGLRLAQLPGAFDHALLRKIVGPSNDVRGVPEGVFIEGRHVYLYLRPDGAVAQDETRIAHNTLITERGDVLLRLEGDATLTYERARRLIARTGA
jgi:hypothetical protein